MTCHTLTKSKALRIRSCFYIKPGCYICKDRISRILSAQLCQYIRCQSTGEFLFINRIRNCLIISISSHLKTIFRISDKLNNRWHFCAQLHIKSRIPGFYLITCLQIRNIFLSLLRKSPCHRAIDT